MKPEAVDQARSRLSRAQTAAEAILAHKAVLPNAGLNKKEFSEFQSLWTDFILAASAIYSKLEQGAKGNSKSEAWFGRKKHERRKDPLLRYLQQARNADEHGLELSMQQLEPQIQIRTGETGGSAHVQKAKGPKGEPGVQITNLGTTPITITPLNPFAHLATVKDTRFGDSFDPPSAHLGKPIENPSTAIAEVVRLGTEYLSALVREASGLSK
jgi:hypothetical protein